MARPIGNGVKEKVISLLKEGKTYSQISKEVGCSSGTISYHSKTSLVGRWFPKVVHDSVAVQSYYDEGHSRKECLEHFGMGQHKWSKLVKSGEIVVRKIPIDEYSHRGGLKYRLIRDGLVKEECSECGLTHWRGKKLGLHLHHKNGQSGDNTVINVCLLCPNCHSITETYGGRNKGIALVEGAKIRKDRQ